MKQSPEMQRLEEMLRSSVLVAGGFMGTDSRPATEIIEADAAELARLGISAQEAADRMKTITDKAIQALGNWAQIDERRWAKVDEARGTIACPWSDARVFRKRVTTVRLSDSDRRLHWSDLSIHMIGVHGFFEGRGSSFRIEPAELASFLR